MLKTYLLYTGCFYVALQYSIRTRQSAFFQPELALLFHEILHLPEACFIFVNCNCTLQFQVLAGEGDRRGGTGRREKNVVFR